MIFPNKKDFPLLQNRAAKRRRFVYLDSAATSEKPKAVIEAICYWYEHLNANVHDGIYKMAEEATVAFEEVRDTVARFLGAEKRSSIIFTKGTTEGINLVAYAFVAPRLKRGDTILLTEMEHHANIVPWQLLAEEKGFQIKYLPVSERGELLLANIEEELARAKFLSLCHVSNFLGTVNPVKKIVSMARHLGVPVLVDGAQAVSHMPVNLSNIKPDFYVFSGHKMLGPSGIGALYVRQERLASMRPYQGGGKMIEEVQWNKTTFKSAPWKFEAGTQPMASVYALGAAIDYLEKVGVDEIAQYLHDLVCYTYEEMSKIPEVTIYGPEPSKRGSVISFNVSGIPSHDLATFLDEYGICIRAGHHCAQPIHDRFQTEGSARASFHLYNDKDDVDYFLQSLKKIIQQWQHSITKYS